MCDNFQSQNTVENLNQGLHPYQFLLLMGSDLLLFICLESSWITLAYMNMLVII